MVKLLKKFNFQFEVRLITITLFELIHVGVWTENMNIFRYKNACDSVALKWEALV